MDMNRKEERVDLMIKDGFDLNNVKLTKVRSQLNKENNKLKFSHSFMIVGNAILTNTVHLPILRSTLYWICMWRKLRVCQDVRGQQLGMRIIDERVQFSKIDWPVPIVAGNMKGLLFKQIGLRPEVYTPVSQESSAIYAQGKLSYVALIQIHTMKEELFKKES
ncbi:hypothetical protein BTVI_130404 [Pitangus sulphuratus]|nr:hypothetical protein BTVI_130404 [Pitangus sulphuratus]